ncbi:MAG: EscU/YscU/HrcU family type III secretion system export apparatus switch protein [Oscillospiraceae bacterium]|nr:EscU/YscU/HrcU family type III secretion system export apparatus switch protein [Oscillospiraceae bacterium]
MSESNQEMRAAALRYNPETDRAPVVVAAGTGYVASKILQIADECGVAVYHDDTAATLLSKLKLGREVPPELYQLVVDVYLTIITAADNAKKNL